MSSKAYQHEDLWFRGMIKDEFIKYITNYFAQHVSRALETLEYSWRHVRLYGGVEYETFEAMLSSNLVP